MKPVKLSDLVSVEEALWVPSFHPLYGPPSMQRGGYTPLQHSASGFIAPGTENPDTWGICALVSHIQVVVKLFNAALQMPPTETPRARAEQYTRRAQEAIQLPCPSAETVTDLSELLLPL